MTATSTASSESSLSPTSSGSPRDDEVEELATHDVRPANAYRMKMLGMKIPAIARAFKVSERTVHRWFAKHVDEFRSSLESQPAANLISIQLLELEEMQRQAQSEAANCSSRREKNSFYKTALSAKAQIIQLLLSTGVIPKTPEKLYSVMLEEKRGSSGEDERGTRSAEEVRASIIQLIQSGRTVT